MRQKDGMVSMSELRGRSDEELGVLLRQMQEQLNRAYFQSELKQLPKTHTLGIKRRYVAQLQTVLSERRMQRKENQ